MEKDKSWIEELTIEDLPNQDLQIIASVVGFDVAIRLIYELAGFEFTVPKHSLSHLKYKYIAKKYDGTKGPSCKIFSYVYYLLLLPVH